MNISDICTRKVVHVEADQSVRAAAELMRTRHVGTLFDLITFSVLLAMARGSQEIFRTGWFLESLLTELWILLVIRTYRPFYRSRPGRFLAWSTGAMTLVAIALPFSPGADAFGFVPLPGPVLVVILAITALYVAVSEASKRLFYRRLGAAHHAR